MHALVTGGFRDGFATAFAAIVLVALLVPTIAVHSLSGAALAALALIVSSLLRAPDMQVLAVQLAVAACAFAGPLLVSQRSQDVRTVVSAATTIALFVWLASPVWTSHYGSMSQRAVDLHPLLVINGLLEPTGAWTHRPVMYSLTNLGQDVSYVMPRSSWACVALHAGAAAPFIAIAAAGRLRRGRTVS